MKQSGSTVSENDVLNCFQQLPHLLFTEKLDSKLNPAFE